MRLGQKLAQPRRTDINWRLPSLGYAGCDFLKDNITRTDGIEPEVCSGANASLVLDVF
jgi:hypothetical protein